MACWRRRWNHWRIRLNSTQEILFSKWEVNWMRGILVGICSKDEMVVLIEDNSVRRIYVSSPTFEFVQFLFACVLFHYTHLDTHIHKTHHLRASPIFIAAGRSEQLHKFALTRYPGTRTTYTPYFTLIPPHGMLTSEMESLKDTFKQHTRDIVQ